MSFIPYISTGEADAFAKSIQEKRWQGLASEEKTFIIFYATIDIEMYHKQPRQAFNVPWKLGDIWIKEATKLQTLFVMRTKQSREWQERAKIMTDEGINDRIIDVSKLNTERPQLDPEAAAIIDQKFGSLIAMANQKFWGRG